MAGSEIRPGVRVNDVHLGEDTFSVDLVAGRTITVPDAWYSRLLHARPEQRSNRASGSAITCFGLEPVVPCAGG